MNDLRKQKEKIFRLMKDEWNEDTEEPDQAKFRGEISKFIKEIQDKTEKIYNYKDNISQLNQELNYLEMDQEQKLKKLGAKQPKSSNKQSKEHFVQEDRIQEKNRLEKYRTEIKKKLFDIVRFFEKQ